MVTYWKLCYQSSKGYFQKGLQINQSMMTSARSLQPNILFLLWNSCPNVFRNIGKVNNARGNWWLGVGYNGKDKMAGKNTMTQSKWSLIFSVLGNIVKILVVWQIINDKTYLVSGFQMFQMFLCSLLYHFEFNIFGFVLLVGWNK